MSIEKFNKLHIFINNLDDEDIVRGNVNKDESPEILFPKNQSDSLQSDRSTAKYLYVRTGFFGKLWQIIFSGSEGATQRRKEAKDVIMDAISDLKSINDTSEIINKISTLTEDTSKDFDTKKLKQLFLLLADEVNSTPEKIINKTESGSALNIDYFKNNSTAAKENKNSGTDYSQNNSQNSSPELNNDEITAIYSSKTIPEFINTNKINDSLLNVDKALTNIATAPDTELITAVLKDVKNVPKDKFGLIAIDERRPVIINSSNEIGVFCADAYVAPDFYSKKINLLDKINGHGSPVRDNTVFSSGTLKINRGEQTLLESGESIKNVRPYYKLTVITPNFEYKIKSDLNEEELINYNKACSDYQAELLKIYSDTFDKLLELQSESSESPIQTIALIPLGNQAGQLRDIEIDVLVSFVTLFQQDHPNVRIAIVTNARTKGSDILQAFNSA